MTMRIKDFYPDRSGWLVIMAMGLGLVSCSRSAEICYYQLSAMTRETTATAADISLNKVQPAVIGIGPVRLPEYLQRPQLVTRLDSNRLQLTDGHRWAEPLADNITRVIRENLTLLLENNRLHRYPWQRSLAVDRQLIIDIMHFEGDGDRSVQLVAVWQIKNGQGEVLLPPKRSSFQVPYPSLNYSGQTGALSETLSLFCREVAEELRLVDEQMTR